MSRKWETVVLTSVTKAEPERHGEFTSQVINVSGDPGMGAVVGAVIDNYPVKTHDQLERFFADHEGKPVALLKSGENMLGAAMLTVWEGKVYRREGGFAFLPKGARTKGYRIPADFKGILDATAGYGVEKLRTRVHRIRDRYPTVRPLTKERLAELPARSDRCTLAVFGTFGLALQDKTHEAVWLVHSYQAEDDIVEGVLLVPGFAGDSEHGSIYGDELIRFGGEVVGPVDISFRDALDLTHVSEHDEVLAALRPSTLVA